jgi:pimeloyl-ACP methyl ester carboxylesterase
MSEGQPVLFLHGAWHGPWAWDDWLSLFEVRGYAPQALTLRGHGPGERGYRGVGIRDYVKDLEESLKGQPQVPVLVGHSLGGLLIQHLLAGWRLPAAVLLAPIPGRYPPGVILRNSIRHPVAMAKSTIRNDLAGLVESPRLVRELLFTPHTPAEVVSRCHMQMTGAWPGLFRQMVATQPPDPDLGTPTLLLAADGDSSFTVKMQRKLAGKLGADFRIIRGSGHNLPVDTPWREAARATLEFLAEHAPAQTATASTKSRS